MIVVDERMQARRYYTDALKEARRKHEELCAEIGLTGPDVDWSFESWLDGWEFDIQSDGKGGSILCMTRGRLPEGGFANPEADGIEEVPYNE